MIAPLDWGIVGAALVIDGALLAAAGQVLSGAAMSLEDSAPSLLPALLSGQFNSLALVSIPRVLPTPVRLLGLIACALFAVVSLQIFAGRALTPLSEPLPFFAYPFLVFTLFGWAWSCVKPSSEVR